VLPADLPNFRLTHDFRGPCCLCARQDVEGTYTESAVFIGEDGPNFGKYMAGCASDQCGYLSKPFQVQSVFDQMFLTAICSSLHGEHVWHRIVARKIPFTMYGDF